MAGKDARHRWVIAGSFAAQAAVIAVVAINSARADSAGSSAEFGPAPPAAIPAPAAAPPVPAAPTPAVPLPPGAMAGVVSAARPGGAAQTGDIGFPAPEDPPRLVIKPGAPVAITVDVTVQAGDSVRGLWLGIAAEKWTGAPHVERRLLRVGQPLGPGRYTFTLHWTMPAGTPAGSGALLVLDAQRPSGADEAPIAELAAG